MCVGSCRNSESREVLMSLPILLGVQRWAFIGRPAQGDGASFSEIMGWSSGGGETGSTMVAAEVW